MTDNVDKNATEQNPVADPVEQSAEFTPDVDPRVRRINALYESLVRNQNAAWANALEIGRELLDIKAELDHGEFLPWLKKNCPKISIRRAEEYMRAAHRLEAMPDLLPELGERSFSAAEKLIDREWRQRGMKVLNSVVAIEREIRRCHAGINFALNALHSQRGDSGLQEWIAGWDLTQEIVDGWTLETAKMIGKFGRKRDPETGTPGRPVPASMFPNPKLRQAEEETLAEAETIGNEPVEVGETNAESVASMTPEEQRAYGAATAADLAEEVAGETKRLTAEGDKLDEIRGVPRISDSNDELTDEPIVDHGGACG